MHSNLEIYADKIFYYRNAFNNPEKIIEDLENTDKIISDQDVIKKWVDWSASDGNYTFGKTKKTEKNNYETSNQIVKKIYDDIVTPFEELSIDYFLKTSISDKVMTPITISKYYEGKQMGPHQDYDSHISAVGYLNDNYEGGELNFPSHDVCIKPEAGSIIFFPSMGDFIHDPRPMYGAEKYIVPAFWVDK